MSTSCIGIVGAGEAGREFARGLAEASVSLCLYDITVDTHPEPLHAFAQSVGATVVPQIGDLAIRCPEIFIFTSASSVLTLAQTCAKQCPPSSLYVDCNTTTPELMRRAWEASDHHPGFVDAAIMAPVPGHQHTVPMMVSGPGAQRFLDRFGPLGIRATWAGEEPGMASLIKLARSAFMKGLAALVFETIALAETSGTTRAVLQSLSETIGPSFRPLVSRLVTGTYTHANRRLTEVEGVVEVARTAGLATPMTDATRDIFRRVVTQGNPGFGLAEQYFGLIPDLFQYDPH